MLSTQPNKFALCMGVPFWGGGGGGGGGEGHGTEWRGPLSATCNKNNEKYSVLIATGTYAAPPPPPPLPFQKCWGGGGGEGDRVLIFFSTNKSSISVLLSISINPLLILPHMQLKRPNRLPGGPDSTELTYLCEWSQNLIKLQVFIFVRSAFYYYMPCR